MSIGIYKIISPTNKIYIGQSIDIEKRWDKNYKTLRCKSQIKLYNSLKKYGWENHIKEIIEECNEEQLLERETYWKLFYKVLEIPSLCCRTDGRFGSMSQETKQKISEGLLKANIKRNNKTKIQISKNMPNRKKVYQYDLIGNLIKIWGSIKEAEKENKGNIKNNILGKTKYANGFIWLREENKDQIKERINILNNYQSPKIGCKLSKEHKNNLSKSIQGKKKNYKQNLLNVEIIKQQYETLSTNQLAKIYNISVPTILSYLKNKNIYKFRKNYA
jgi:hypothetical protein